MAESEANELTATSSMASTTNLHCPELNYSGKLDVFPGDSADDLTKRVRALLHVGPARSIRFFGRGRGSSIKVPSAMTLTAMQDVSIKLARSFPEDQKYIEYHKQVAAILRNWNLVNLADAIPLRFHPRVEDANHQKASFFETSEKVNPAHWSINLIEQLFTLSEVTRGDIAKGHAALQESVYGRLPEDQMMRLAAGEEVRGRLFPEALPADVKKAAAMVVSGTMPQRTSMTAEPDFEDGTGNTDIATVDQFDDTETTFSEADTLVFDHDYTGI